MLFGIDQLEPQPAVPYDTTQIVKESQRRIKKGQQKALNMTT